MNLSHSYSAIKLYENCPLRYLRQRIIKDVIDEGGEASKHGERIHKYLENRMQDKTELPQEVAGYEPLCAAFEASIKYGQLYVEKELVLNSNLLPTGWWDADAWFRSKLDILIVRGTKAIVLDWKTGKRNIDFFQMQIFAVQVFKHYPEVQTVATSLVWLKSMEMDTETYTREQSNELWAEIIKRIQRIQSSLDHDNWPARPSGLCRFCPARHDCDYAKI